MKVNNDKDKLELTIELPKFNKEYLKKLEDKNSEKLEVTIKIPKISYEELKEKLTKMNNKKKRKKYISSFIIIVLFGIGIFYVFNIFNNLEDKKRVNETNDKILDKIEINESIVDNATNINPPDDKNNIYWKYINYSMLDVDLNKLKNENSDTTGWIYTNNTNINYPIVQSTDNEFYLKHQFDKTKNSAGWVFMDYRNDKISSNNKNTIVYGHGLKNKAIFGTLNKVLNENWYTNVDNLVIKTIDMENTYLWQIFSIYKIETTDDYLQTKFIDDEHYLEWLNMLKLRSINNFDVSLNSTDKILTLQTCYNNDLKTVVHAKLIKLASVS